MVSTKKSLEYSTVPAIPPYMRWMDIEWIWTDHGSLYSGRLCTVPATPPYMRWMDIEWIWTDHGSLYSGRLCTRHYTHYMLCNVLMPIDGVLGRIWSGWYISKSYSPVCGMFCRDSVLKKVYKKRVTFGAIQRIPKNRKLPCQRPKHVIKWVFSGVDICVFTNAVCLNAYDIYGVQVVQRKPDNRELASPC